MALTRATDKIIGDANGNLNLSGIITATTFSGNITGNVTGNLSGGTINATSGTVTGNLGVGGVLTYEDVTNIDSVGVITARAGINITGNMTATGIGSFGGNMLLVGTTNDTTVGTVNKNLIVGSTTNNDEVGLTLNVMEGAHNRRVKLFLDDDDGVFGVDSTATTGVSPFVVRMAESEKLRIDTSGNLLLGATSYQKGGFGGTSHGINVAGTQPQVLLHETDTDKDGFFGLASSILRIQTADAIPVTIWTSDTQRLQVTSTGRLNTGDTDLTQNVDQFCVSVTANNAMDNVARFQSTAASSGHSETLVKIYKGAGYGGVISGYITQGSDHGLKFYTANNASLSERVRIKSNGRIGIGTDNPDNEVEINGAAQFTSGGDVDGPSMLVYPHPDVTLANNASTTLNFPNRFTGLVVVNGKGNDTPAVIYALASASAYASDGATRLMIQNHPASNISDLTITSPSHGGTYQYQLNQTGSSTKTYKIFAFGIFGS